MMIDLNYFCDRAIDVAMSFKSVDSAVQFDSYVYQDLSIH